MKTLEEIFSQATSYAEAVANEHGTTLDTEKWLESDPTSFCVINVYSNGMDDIKYALNSGYDDSVTYNEADGTYEFHTNVISFENDIGMEVRVALNHKPTDADADAIFKAFCEQNDLSYPLTEEAVDRIVWGEIKPYTYDEEYDKSFAGDFRDDDDDLGRENGEEI